MSYGIGFLIGEKNEKGINDQIIHSLYHSHLDLKTAVSVILEYDGYQFIAYAPDIDTYGCGETDYLIS